MGITALILGLSAPRLHCVISSVPVTVASIVLPLKHTKCWYASKQGKLADLIRWNTENKLLFGSKQKMIVGKKSADNAASVIKRNRGNKKKPPESESVDKITKVRLEEMYLSSVSEKHEKDSIARKTSAHQKIYSHSSSKLLEDKNGNEHIFKLHSVQGEDNVDINITKCLPIPEVQAIATNTGANGNNNNKVSKHTTSHLSIKESTSKDQMSSISTYQEIECILQFPLFPENTQNILPTVQVFHDFIKSLGLRLLPTVKTIISKTRTDLGNLFLQRWREKMTEELGEAGFKKHQEALIWQGTNLHACVQQYLSGVPITEIQIQENCQGYWDSITTILPDVTEVLALETNISHPFLFYKGTVDCIAKYRDIHYLIDWKTSSKPKPLLSNLFDDPLQVAAYIGAFNSNADLISKFGVIKRAAIVVAYHNGETAHIHKIEPALCQHYWNQWCQRLHQYWMTVAAEKRT